VLKKRGQIAGKPSVCRRLATLESWSKRDNWREQAEAYDAEQARRRARELAEQERTQLAEDLRTLASTIRGMVAVSALVLNSYVDENGALRRQGELRDVAILVKSAIDGLHVVYPHGWSAGPSASDIDVALRLGSPQQRSRAMAALQELQTIVRQVEGRG
jgi:hypothetical protein